VRRVGRITPLLTTGVGVALVGLGIVYLVVACEALPGFMGPTPGDTSPRTGLGVAGLVLGLAAFSIAALLARRQSQHG
jgi:amino acid permease